MEDDILELAVFGGDKIPAFSLAQFLGDYNLYRENHCRKLRDVPDLGSRQTKIIPTIEISD
jgi:hypothetical protein